jgi:hypothetical protein
MQTPASTEATQISCLFENAAVKRSPSPLEFPDVAERQLQHRSQRVTDQDRAEPGARL